jgi:N6-L-threonylcarbamoyladenine synthase
MVILGIETSCDETAAAIYCSDKKLLSNALYSQIDLHKKYGGVVPELASRGQLEKIHTIVKEALDRAQLSLNEIDAIAVTHQPGLPGSLLVGVCFAKALAWAKNKKLIGVNHLEGHAFSAYLENDIPFPHICLTASGGHTSLYLVEDFGVYTILGQTQDDAAGEAFDKIAKLMNLPYPGGPVIENMAAQVGFKDFYEYPRGKPKNLNFSFSGLKTAVLYDLIKKGSYDMTAKLFIGSEDNQLQQKVASSFLICVADIFEQKVAYALSLYPHIKAVTFVGGVACNKYITQRLNNYVQGQRLAFYSPSRQFCTDNAAMIAFVGSYKAEQGYVSDLSLDIR